MKKIFQNIKNGETILEDVPVPSNQSNNLLISSSLSLISPGTEKMLTEFGSQSWLTRIRKNPDRVAQVLSKIKTDGILPTIESVNSKLNIPIELGYCNVGEVVDIGMNVRGFKIGDRVISNGSHADFNSVSKNLVAKVPDNVNNQTAVFTVLAAVGLQGIRLANLTIGEKVIVIGLGVIGLLTTQILISHGCEVLCIDINDEKLDIARKYGAKVYNSKKLEFLGEVADEFTDGVGADAVIITSSSNDNSIIHNAAKISRKRGRIILVGVTGLKLNRDDFYEKELSFQVSCSYGPGRYDDSYEVNGNDYPIGYVRWTEKRNFEFVLELMSKGKLKVDELISSKYSFNEAIKAYSELNKQSNLLGIIFDYGNTKKEINSVIQLPSKINRKSSNQNNKTIIGIIGSGNFTSKVILPNLSKIKDIRLRTIASNTGSSSTHSAKKYSFEINTTDTNEIIDDKQINTIFICSRHNTHSEFVIKSLERNKNIFVEKPLALSLEELENIKKAYSKSSSILFVDFNRRFSSLAIKARNLLANNKLPKAINFNINSGEIDKKNWVQDINIGGGRIIGEVCHFIDFLFYLTQSEVSNWNVINMDNDTNDTVSISLKFKDGSIGNINYFSNGNNKYPKENIEVFSGNKVLKLENFLKLKGYGWSRFKSKKLWSQDKGHAKAIRDFISSTQNEGCSSVSFEEIYNVSKLSIEISNKILGINN